MIPQGGTSNKVSQLDHQHTRRPATGTAHHCGRARKVTHLLRCRSSAYGADRRPHPPPICIWLSPTSTSWGKERRGVVLGVNRREARPGTSPHSASNGLGRSSIRV